MKLPSTGALACWVLLMGCGGSQPAPEPVVVAPTPDATPEPEEAAPSAADFESGKPLELSGGPALGCEARGVRDWVRVRCTGLAYFGSPPWRAAVDTGSAGHTAKISQQLGDVQLTWRHSEGSDLHASFVWFPNMVRLHAEWPKGKERPIAVARFVGVPSRSAKESIEAACACSPRLGPDMLLKTAGYTCESPTLDAEGIDAWEPECLRELLTGCQEFNECLTREPSGARPCGDDEHASGLGPFTSCHKTCDETRRCAAGFSCEDAYEHNPMGDPPETRVFACFPEDDAQTQYYLDLNTYLERRKP